MSFFHSLKRFIFLLALVVLLPLSAYAVPEIKVAQEVEQGLAFPLSITDTNPTYDTITVLWQDKKFPLLVEKTKDGISANVLLAMPIEATKTQTLEIITGSTSTKKQIAVQRAKWQKQTLNVEPKYSTPPAEVMDQIKKDRTTNANMFLRYTQMNGIKFPLTRPGVGIITSPFGAQRVFNGETKSTHRGVDFRGAVGVSVFAVADGVVAVAEEQYYSGNVIYIDHGQGVYSAYAHLSAFLVKEGDIVKAGQNIGKIGATGRVTGPHLHLGFIVQGISVDFLPLLEKNPKVVNVTTAK